MIDIYEIKITCTKKDLPKIEAVFDELTTTSSYVMLPRDKFECTAYTREKPELPKGHKFTVSKLKDRNWLKESLISFKPMRIGQFYVYGTHIKKAPPEKLIGIKVDAATAFGSGEHGTTQGCLMALTELTEAKNILDIGTGTGILAIAAAKKFPKAKVLATDIDPESVRVAKENAKLNGVKYKTILSDGFAHKDMNKGNHFDVIFANILARPLIEMSDDIYKAAAKGGRVVVSGLLKRQKKWVKEAFLGVGFKYEKAYDLSPWSALQFKK